ncbi:MAG: hypothetical protein H0V18_17670, partial [Pyrinomonadaceae bacterium]|nr:hypothetical protein [Pyrinomonadaceae bacterium]
MAKKVWRSFEEARKFVHQLRLKNQKDWQAYATTGDRPGDVPSNPCRTYKSEFKDWGDWLGTRSVARWKRRFRPFAEAREYVHQLGLKGQSEWQAYAKTSDRPRDVPSDPARAYRTAFKDWGDWLGTSAVARQNRSHRSYSEARQFVQGLGLKNKRDWLAYVRTGQKPDDIPSNAALVYGPEFKGWGDWLNTGRVANQNRTFRPYAEARDFARALGLKNQKAWQAYAQTDGRPEDIPVNPASTY